MRQARRWLLGALLITLIGLLWWARAARHTPLDPDTLSRMTEPEQMAWLIERITERGGHPNAFSEVLYEWFPRLRTRYTPHTNDVELLAMACVEYELEETLQRLRAWAKTPREQDSLSGARAQLHAKRRKWADALGIARAIREQDLQIRAFCTIATEQAQAGQRSEAQATLTEALRLIRTPIAGGELLVSTATRLKFPELAEQATGQTVSSHSQDYLRSSLVAPAYAESGQISEAVRVARQVSDRILRGLAYAEIARVLLQQGQIANAIALITTADEPSGYARAARYLDQHGRTDQARAFWAKAQSKANRLSRLLRSRALLQIATEYALAGDPQAALRILQQAPFPTSPEHWAAISAITHAYVAQGKQTEAIQLTRLAPQGFARVELHTAIAAELYRRGYHDDARRVLQQIRPYLQHQFGDWKSAPEWECAVALLAQPDTRPLAQELVNQLESAAQTIVDPHERHAVDLSLAQLYARIGNLPKAIRCAARHPEPTEQTVALIQIVDSILAQKSKRL